MTGRWSWPGARTGTPEPGELARQAETLAALADGRVPPATATRLELGRDAANFSSDLRSRDLVALRSAGFEPVGQAFGTSTYSLSGQRNYFGPPFHPWSYPMTPGWSTPIGVPSVGTPQLLTGFHGGENECRARALDRLRGECAALGADGVLGIRVDRVSPTADTYTYTVIGTAVRIRGGPAQSARPFFTMLSAAELAALRRGGWCAVDLVFDLSRFAIHGGFLAGSGLLNPLSYANAEVAGATTVLTAVRVHGRQVMERALRAVEAEGMIVHSMTAQLSSRECFAQSGSTDFFADGDIVGTAIAPADRGAAPAQTGRARRSTAVLRLDDAEGTRQ